MFETNRVAAIRATKINFNSQDKYLLLSETWNRLFPLDFGLKKSLMNQNSFATMQHFEFSLQRHKLSKF
ncbi:hypothetical protein BpHYR1_014489 [Brachionus plicatilis]|uniref:Uncharacterized protein n=1 Tax=Brachionus plicatilis TaxID=10195 RepID=A0A3M7R9V3_BRAPC|nr:hypothetical protein BpHYR1_014489 [Brachionus plicatilis]